MRTAGPLRTDECLLGICLSSTLTTRPRTATSKGLPIVSSTPSVIYIPPTQADTITLSRDACTALAALTGDPHYTDENIVFGLASFLQTCGTILANRMNRGTE